MEQIEVRIYETRSRKAPFSTWLHGLEDPTGRAAVRIRIARLRLGNFGDCKSIGDGIFELRIAVGPGYRVYFGRRGQQIVILLCGGDKRTQGRDIEKAKEYWKDYRERKNG